MTLIFQSTVESGGNRKISGAHSCSWPLQNGHSDWVWLGFAESLDLKSEGLRALAGEKTTHRFVTVSFLISGSRPAILRNAAAFGRSKLYICNAQFFYLFSIPPNIYSKFLRKLKKYICFQYKSKFIKYKFQILI